jgi:hypothetical protein
LFTKGGFATRGWLQTDRKRMVAMSPNSFIKISFTDGNSSKCKDVNAICAILSCWHKAHQAALEDDGALERGWHCYESE